jgi:hypothetical protein
MWCIHTYSVNVEMLQCIPIVFLPCIELSTMEPLGGALEKHQRIPFKLLLRSKIFRTVNSINACL